MNIQQWLGELIPEAYRRYQPVLERCLLYFVQNLESDRQQEILLHQLEANTSAERMTSLMRDCPTLHKLGQILARDPRLDESFRHKLRELESCLPLAGPEDYDWPVELQPERALAEGSVASVFACRWGEAEVVCKQLKPGVAERLRQEFAIWDELGRHLRDWCLQEGLAVFDYRTIIASLVRLLEDELHPSREQRQLLLAAQRFQELPEVQVPRLYPQLRGLVMERLYGTPLLEHERAGELFPLAVRVLITDPFFTTEEEGVFHLDPHPGNLWVTREGRLALLDWGSVLVLSKQRRALLTHALLSAWRGDQQDWEFYASQLTGAPVGECPRASSLSGLLRPECWGDQFPLDLILLRKILFHLEGVEAELGETQLLWHVFTQAAVRFLAELPLRLAAPLNWRGFATHLSTLDIVRHTVLHWLKPPDE
ncbi:MAG: AarF/UbiB family protein [Vulcanimicrobiota bacterium]